MMDFFHTLGEGIAQGFWQYIDNDLSSHVPLFVIAAILLIGVGIKAMMNKR